jgi:hypothetical protein
MQHEPATLDQPWDASDEQGRLIARARPLVLDLCRHVEPALQVTLRPYRWHGDAVLDIGLALGGHQHHLQVTASRMKILLDDPDMLEHDIEGAVEDLRREAERGAPHPPDEKPHPSAAHAAAMPHPPPEVHGGPPAVPTASEGSGVVAPAADQGVAPGEEAILEQTRDLVRHIVAELDHAAVVTFDEYRWHGDLVLDIAVSLHGHEHRLQVSASRAAIILRDHGLLEHDLEEVLHALHQAEHSG